MISEANCINIVDISMSANIFEIFSYGFDQNRSAPLLEILSLPLKYSLS